MFPIPCRRFRLLAAAFLLPSMALAGCGDPSPEPSGEAAGAPTADPGSVELLQRLSSRLQAGQALSDESWGQDVDFLRRLLWPDTATPAAAAASQAHAAASHVAGDVARELARDPGARAGLVERDPASLALHDGWIAAAAAGPEGYRSWCEGPGQDLLAGLRAARERLFERPGAVPGR